MTAWTADTFDGSFGTVAVAGGVVYEAEACDQLSAFDALTGKRFWFFRAAARVVAVPRLRTTAARSGCGTRRIGNLIVDASGRSLGRSGARTRPILPGGLAFYMRTKTLTAVEVATSAIKWSFIGDGMLCSSASIAGRNGTVFVGSASGNVYELDETTGHQNLRRRRGQRSQLRPRGARHGHRSRAPDRPRGKLAGCLLRRATGAPSKSLHRSVRDPITPARLLDEGFGAPGVSGRTATSARPMTDGSR